LTQTEVESIFSYYGWSGTFQQVAPYISLPFDCSNYGDLCPELGLDNAHTFICNRWSEAASHDSEATIATNAQDDWDTMEDEWFDERFPDGIGSSHPWWGTITTVGSFAPMTSSSCGPTETEENLAGDRRVRTHAGYTITVVYNDVHVSVRAQKQHCILGFCGWKKDTSANVGVTATWQGTDDSTSELCESIESGSDTDGKVTRYDPFFGILGYWWEVSTGYGASSSYSLSTDEACKNTPWNYVGC